MKNDGKSNVNSYCTQSSNKTALEYFRMMSQDMRSEIGQYLSEDELKNLKMVSRDFYGPIGKAKFKYKYKEKWAKQSFVNVMKPIDKLFNKSVNVNNCSEGVIGFGLFLVVMVSFLPSLACASVASSVGFFSGAVAEKIKPKIKETRANHRIRPFIGEQITFQKTLLKAGSCLSVPQAHKSF